MVLRRIRKNRIYVVCAVLPVIVLLGACGGNGVETMGDSVSGAAIPAEEISAGIPGSDAAGGEAASGNETAGGEAASGSAGETGSVMPEQGEAAGAGVSGDAIPTAGDIDIAGSAVANGETVSGNSDTGSSAVTNDGEAGAVRPAPVKVKGIYVSGPVAGTQKMDDLIDLVDRTELNAMVIDVKNDEGKVTYKMESEQVKALEAGIRYIPDIETLVQKCKEKDIYLIARIVAFRDPYLAEKKPEWAVHTKDGKIFRDKKGLAWVNPYQRDMWDYLTEIASRAAADGFDEVQFDYIRFSTDIGEDEVDYGPEAVQIDKVGIITEFTKYLYEKLAPQGVYVAADVFGTVIDNETDQKIVGQDYIKMATHLDYICPMVYPSHYHNGAYGIKVPDAEPYATIYAASSSSVQELTAISEEKRAHVRVWLQGFTAKWVPGHIGYGPQQIREQIKGAYDAGYEEWILWNAGVNYQPEALLTEEEAGEERARWDAERAETERMRQEEEKAEAERRQREEAAEGPSGRQEASETGQTPPEAGLPAATDITETKKKLQD